MEISYPNLAQICQGFIGQAVTLSDPREFSSGSLRYNLVAENGTRFGLFINNLGFIRIVDESKPLGQDAMFSGNPAHAMCHQMLETVGKMISAPQAVRLLGFLDTAAMEVFCSDAINEGHMLKHEYSAAALKLEADPSQ